ncbi:MAG: hypothetical protein ABI068_00065 [Ktedonobacterales bacterium]
MDQLVQQQVQQEQHEHLARCVALTQERRGHGASTSVYYLGRALVTQGLRVLLVDLTGRHTRLQSLMAHGPAKNLGLWTPPVPRPEKLAGVLAQAQRQTRGKVDVLLLEADAAWLERAGGVHVVDYTLMLVEPSAQGQEAADHIAHRLGDQLPPYGRVGVVFGRADVSALENLPDRTENRHLPILGAYPADYLLAAGDDYSLKGGEPSWPHDNYLTAMLRLARQLARAVPLFRLTSGVPATADRPATPHPTPSIADAGGDDHPNA